MAVIGELATLITARTGPFERSMGRASSAMLGFTAKAAAATAGMTALAGAIATGVRQFAELERSQIALEVLTGSVEKTKGLMEELVTFAAQTPFQLGELTKASKQLAAFGFQAEEIIDLTRRLGDISAGIDAPIGELASIIGKMRVQGRLFQIDINQLSNRGIPAVKALSENFGVTGEQLRQMVKDGKVGFDDLRRAIERMTGQGGRFEGLMERLSTTLSGKFSTALDNLKLSAAELVETFRLDAAAKSGLDAISEMAKDVANAMRRLRERRNFRPRPSLQSGSTGFSESVALGASPFGRFGRDDDPRAPARGLQAALQSSRRGFIDGLMKIGKSLSRFARDVERNGKAIQKTEREAIALRKSLRTPFEIFRDRLKELLKFRGLGLLSADAFTRGIVNARQAALAATPTRSGALPRVAGAAFRGSAAANQILARARDDTKGMDEKRNKLLEQIRDLLESTPETEDVVESLIGGVAL